MKKFVRSSRYTNYQGQLIPVNDGETPMQAKNRYKAQLDKEESDRLAEESARLDAERISREEKAKARNERKKIPKYKDGDLVLGKDGKYYKLYEPYYHEPDDTVYYEAFTCDEFGNLIDNSWGFNSFEIDQKDIQRKIKSVKSSRVSASSDMFGYDDSQFFTRDDEREYIEMPLDAFIRDYADYWGGRLNLRCYIEGNKLEVDCDFDGWETTLKTTIDFRKIRKPSDLKKYLPALSDQFVKEWEEYNRY